MAQRRPGLIDEAGAARPEVPGVLSIPCVNAVQNARIELEEETLDQIIVVPQFLERHEPKGREALICQVLLERSGAAAVDMGLNRWWRVVGGLLMNLALGSLYAWSVFVAPLEKEFGWKRADTSQVFTWAVVVFAISFIIAGRLQDKLGPFMVSITGCILLTAGFLLSAQDRQPDVPDHLLRRHRRHR